MSAAETKTEAVTDAPAVEEIKPPSADQLLYQSILKYTDMLEEAVKRKDRNKLSTVSKHNRNVRVGLKQNVINAVLASLEAKDRAYAELRSSLGAVVAQVKEVEMSDNGEANEIKLVTYEAGVVHAYVPEVEAYLRLLVLYFLVDKDEKELAKDLVTHLVDWIDQSNRRTLDLFSAKAYFYYSLVHERLGRLAEIRPKLFTLHRSACLRHDEPGQAALINLILRNLLQDNLVHQADHFMLNSPFPESHSNYQYARYLYYAGRIHAVQLNYSEAYQNLTQVVRRAPQDRANGFREHAHKLLVIVQLLIGDIPEKSLFRTKGIQRALKPYLQLTQAVRVGDLVAFTDLQQKFKTVFVRDRTFNLIVRLRHNVIKAGLRKISLSYSRISISDIAQKLGLDSEADAEYVIAKAIHDGAMDAVIDREHRFIFSKANIDVYSTEEPSVAFNRRTKFCLDVHNEAVKAMRYPDDREEASKQEDFLAEGEVDIEIIDDSGDDLMD